MLLFLEQENFTFAPTIVPMIIPKRDVEKTKSSDLDEIGLFEFIAFYLETNAFIIDMNTCKNTQLQLRRTVTHSSTRYTRKQSKDITQSNIRLQHVSLVLAPRKQMEQTARPPLTIAVEVRQ